MKLPHPITIFVFLLLTAPAVAQMSLVPPASTPAKPAGKPPATANKPPPAAAKKAVRPAPPSLSPPPTANVVPAPEMNNPNVDVVFGAYQRGQYKTAFDLATTRAKTGDLKAMTMLGELYSSALGAPHDYNKAAEWYKRASDAGDREAMFALAMMRIAGRGGPVDKGEAVKLLASATKLGEPKAAYNLALLYLDGQTLPQDVTRAAELLRQAADAGLPQAQYALATFYKVGTGVAQDLNKAVRLLQAASLAGNVDAEVEYAIALFNGKFKGKDEDKNNYILIPQDKPAAVALLRKAARQNSAIAQSRLAWLLFYGDGTPVDKIEGFKWHLIARTAGKGEPELDRLYSELSPADQAKAEAAAKDWLGTK